MRKLLLLLIFFSAANFLLAQDAETDNNITIQKSIREFRIVKGNDAHPVQIKEESQKIYFCNNYRTEIPVVEFYNDMTSIDDVKIFTNGSKKHGIVPMYDYYSADGIFYSDARVCYFKLPLLKQGSTSEVTFRKTTLDPHFFTTIYFMDDKKIENQEVKLIVPSWMQLEIKEFHFAKYRIKKEVSAKGDETVYTFTMQNLPAATNESRSPGPGYYMPHILVLCKSATPNNETFVYFKTVKEQYNWYRQLVEEIGNDPAIIREKTLAITSGLSTDEEKVKAVFQWVQDNIRYIAFEDGIMGFRPAKAQDVLLKKYGDCKGMANLLTEMLRSIHLDARKCWIGTRHIAYDYSTPSLSVDNHMICAWMKNGKPVFLDATEKYIGFGETAERIQGRQTLIENGKEFLLEKIPVASYLQNTASENRKFTLEGNVLKGHSTQTWKGENKEWLLTQLNAIKQDKKENILKEYLAAGMKDFEISNLKITNINDYNADLKVEYDVVWKNAISEFGKESYLDIDNRRFFQDFTIDTNKRKLPYWFQFKNNLVFETEIKIPERKAVTTLPAPLAINQPGYNFKAAYKTVGGKLIYRNEIIITKTELVPEAFTQWNDDIKKLSNFYNQQIEFTTKN